MARSDGKFALKILAENSIVFDERCEAVFLPSTREPIVVMAHHTPMIAKLGSGEVIVKNGKTMLPIATITTGLIYVGDNEATVLLDL